MQKTKNILVVATEDPLEAMRVAAGLTIFGHEVTFLFSLSVEVSEAFRKAAELLELAEVDKIYSLEPFEECEVADARRVENLWRESDLALAI